MPLSKKDVLQAVSFGEQVAEDERRQLSAYFVRTGEAQQLADGAIDIVYAPKGAGKSALYMHLLETADDFERRRIILTACEEPLGTPVFRNLVNDLLQPSEEDLQDLWCLYFTQLIGLEFRKRGLSDSDARFVIQHLEDAKLLPSEPSLARMLRSAMAYIKLFIRPASVEGGIQFNSVTGLPAGITGKISLRDPSEAGRSSGVVSVSSLLERAEKVLVTHRYALWLLLDRLDAAFPSNPALEETALRALFQVYLDLKRHEHIRPKIFLRSDIWERITKTKGFREGSHIRRSITIRWERKSLVNLLCRRLLHSKAVSEFYQVTQSDVLASTGAQERFLHAVIEPTPMLAQGRDTIDWILLGIRDGSNQAAPRELIHLFTAARLKQVLLWGLEERVQEGTYLITQKALRNALPEVSQSRLEQTLYAEYPRLRPFITLLRGESPQQSVLSLAKIWESSNEETRTTAFTLVDLGFFEATGKTASPSFQVPILYRSALSMPSSGSWSGEPER